MGFEIENGVLKKYVEESDVTEVTIPDGVIEIGGEAFIKCTNLTSIVLPDRVTEIGVRAFCSCESLDLVIPDSVDTIDEAAFLMCDDNVIIFAKRGSYAFEYAEESLFPHREIGWTPPCSE